MNRRFVWICVFAIAALALTGGEFLRAQAPAGTSDVYSNLKWRYIGSVGNRVTSVAGVPGNPLIYYVGAASGGVFKSTDGGIHWDAIFDSEPVASIGSIAVAPSDPSIVWVGTGEPFIRSHISIGDGVYKSLDSGKTWTHTKLPAITGRISNVVIDPHDPNTVFACALGTAYGPQQERGVYRTTDGGEKWDRVLFVDENTGCSDMAMDPNNPHILFAGMWQIEIHTWGRTSGGPGSALYRSADGGLTWKRLEGHGLPKSPVGRIAVRVAAKNSNRVYALIETGDGVPFNGKDTERGQLWRSDNGGDEWQAVNYDRDVRGRTAYYTREEIAPDDENEVYFFSAAFSHTLDGGKTLTPMPSSPGGDNHEMWIDPKNGDRMAVVNDGGVSISVNRGHTWDHVSLPVAQIYHVTLDDRIPYFVYGNRQDGPSFRGPSRTLGFGGIPRSVWHPVEGGESGFAIPDPKDNDVIWTSGTGSGSVDGAVFVFNEKTHQARAVEVWPESVSGAPAADLKYRFNWEFPIAISPHDHNKVYVGSQFVHVTTDGGNSWKAISPDLTLNDKTKQGSSGGLTPDNIGVEYAGVVFSIAESPKEAGVIWAGTNDGVVQVTRDGGAHWTNVTANIPGLPAWGTVDNIEASRYQAGAAYITVDFHQMNNRDPFVYKTADYGKTWTQITNGLPHNMVSYAHCVREDPVRKGLLYLGTEGGMYVSFDDGANWQPLQMNLPHVPVYWIAVQERFHDLVLATYGRGFWILDDITSLEQPDSKGDAVHLFAPRDTYRFQATVEPFGMSYDPTGGQNPPYGAAINYFLKTAPSDKDEVKLEILDSSGKTVRKIDKPTKTAGLNRIYWNLRFDESKEIRLRTSPMYAPEVKVSDEGWRDAPAAGRIAILAPPGTYTVKLTVDGQSYTQNFKLLKDPNTQGTEVDIAAQTKLVTAIREEQDQVADCINQLELVRGQLVDLQRMAGGDDQSSKDLKKAAQDLDKKIVAVEGTMTQLLVSGRGQDDVRYPPMLVEKLGYLADSVATVDFAPTTQAVQVNDLLKEQVGKCQQQTRDLMSKDVAAFNSMLHDKNMGGLITKAP
ncbi:MAG TPA: hypothetical protein VFO34_01290 [Candidatus Acidoferrales bacterium]|nr:hypothetical protein [Candidatus Acidoferrales bacterium]